MSAQHTPGPWYCQPEQGGALTIWAGERQLGEVQPDDMGDTLPAEANARLIAEAPAMLEALRGIKWRSDDKDNMEFAARITYVQMDAIRAILSRIDGGAA